MTLLELQHLARISAATCGVFNKGSGCRFARPGYACSAGCHCERSEAIHLWNKQAGLLRRFASRNDAALIQRRISRRRNRPARKQWQPSLRAKRSNPWLGIARSTMDCFVASAPRNDDALIQRRISRRRNRPARKHWQPSLRAQRSNPWLDIARSTMDCFVASLLAMTLR